MRILFLTNFYFVNRSGGEDQSCQQVVKGLQQRGHTTLVLTSMDGAEHLPVEANGICRCLYLEMDLVPWRHSLNFFTQRHAREKHNLQQFERVIHQFAPDIIFIWGMWNLHRSLAALAEAGYPDKVIYRFATYWPTLPSQHEFYWRAPGRNWYSRIAKQVLGRVALAMLAKERRPSALTFKHAICVSEATRNELVKAGIPVANAQVIHTGIDAQPYLRSQLSRPRGDATAKLHLLYAGRLVAEKGVDTLIKALEKIINGQGQRHIKLNVAGTESPAYESYLRQLVSQAGLNDHVTFLGHIPPEDMPQLLQKSDVLVIPSIWPEPFSRMVLEGMCSGLVVVATSTGGTTEILTDGENGVLFAPGDIDDLAQTIVGLAADPEERRRLSLAGQQTVMDGFTQSKMMDAIENYLREVARNASPEIAKRINDNAEVNSPPFQPTVSVIIPTYNRKSLLHETLTSLAQQDYPTDRVEIVVVDDGSTDGTEAIAAETYAFPLRYFRQSNQGDAEARNVGAQQSRAEILVFLDDDMVLEPGYLACLIHAHAGYQNRIVVGTWDLWQSQTSPFSQAMNTSLPTGAYYAHSNSAQGTASNADHSEATTKLAFRDAYSNNMSIRREAYFKIGMMKGLDFSGSSMWCDLDFAYRAYQQGFEFRRSTRVICWHRDHTSASLDTYKKRVKTASYRAVVLFQKYPDLVTHLPMFYDKTPIAWGQDPPRLIARKFLRLVSSSGLALWIMEKVTTVLEKHAPASALLPTLYRYIVGGHIFQGYRSGLAASAAGRYS